MHRHGLLTLLSDYHPTDPRDRDCRDRFVEFVKDHGDCFERALAIGHLTGSAWIVNQSRSRYLLTFHKKLGLWLQLGGHADGETNMAAVALREAREESGLSEIRLIEPGIFDLDIHVIPQYRDVPQHLHYDVRFLCEADDRLPLSLSDESHDLRWLSSQEIAQLTQEESILRMLRKSSKPLNE